MDDETAAVHLRTIIDVTIRDEHVGEAQAMKAGSIMLATAWTMKSLRTAEAIVVLYQNGMDDTADPLRRLMLEVAARIHWMATFDDTEHERVQRAIEVEYQRHRRLLADGAGEIVEPPSTDPWDPDDDALRQVVGQLSQLQQVLAASGRSDWFTYFRLESANSHPTYAAATPYLFSSNDYVIGVTNSASRHVRVPLCVVLTFATEAILGRHSLHAWGSSVMNAVAVARQALRG